MFGRKKVFTRIRAAQAALAAGRIDEAYAMACEAEVRTEERGRQLADELVRPLLARARLAAQRGDYPDALADLDRLSKLGREPADARELRQRVLTEFQARQQGAAEKQAAYARAAANLRAGRLDSGRIDIDRVADAGQKVALQQELHGRLERLEQALDGVRATLKRNDVLAAVKAWHEAGQRYGRNAQTDAVAGELRAALRAACQRWFENGDLERLLAAQFAVDSIAQHDPEFVSEARLVQFCRDAARELAERDYADLRQSLLRLRGLGAAPAWLKAACDAVAEIAQRQDELLASPLGVIAATIYAPPADVRRPPPAERVSMGNLPPPPPIGRPSEGLLVLVDGGGSTLWLRSELVRMGRARGGATVEIPFPAELQTHHADLLRQEEDYFLTAHGPASVNRRPVRGRVLLRDGDAVSLGELVKFVFRKPSARCGSAVLELHHRCRLPQDVSRVVLFDETALIGPHATSHVRTRDNKNQVVVFARDGQYFVREAPLGQRGHVGDARPLRMNETMDIGDIRLTAMPYDPAAGGAAPTPPQV